MVYFGNKQTKEKFEQLEQEIQNLNSKVVYTKTISNLGFTRQVLEQGKVVKYYSKRTDYTTIDTNISNVLSVYMKDIPKSGEHLVITAFTSRTNLGILVEVYQYNSNIDITNDLNTAQYIVSYQKEN